MISNTLLLRSLIGWVVVIGCAYVLSLFWNPSPYFLAFVAFGIFLWWIPDLGKDIDKLQQRIEELEKALERVSSQA